MFKLILFKERKEYGISAYLENKVYKIEDWPENYVNIWLKRGCVDVTESLEGEVLEDFRDVESE